MSQNCCNASFYRTPYNVQLQNMYCNMAQNADTKLENVVTSGNTYIRKKRQEVKEGYCGCNCGPSSDVPMSENYTPSVTRSPSSLGQMNCQENYIYRSSNAGAESNSCPTDFLRTPYNIAYQKLYSNMAQQQDTEYYEEPSKPLYFYNR